MGDARTARGCPRLPRPGGSGPTTGWALSYPKTVDPTAARSCEAGGEAYAAEVPDWCVAGDDDGHRVDDGNRPGRTGSNLGLRVPAEASICRTQPAGRRPEGERQNRDRRWFRDSHR